MSILLEIMDGIISNAAQQRYDGLRNIQSKYGASLSDEQKQKVKDQLQTYKEVQKKYSYAAEQCRKERLEKERNSELNYQDAGIKSVDNENNISFGSTRKAKVDENDCVEILDQLSRIIYPSKNFVDYLVASRIAKYVGKALSSNNGQYTINLLKMKRNLSFTKDDTNHDIIYKGIPGALYELSINYPGIYCVTLDDPNISTEPCKNLTFITNGQFSGKAKRKLRKQQAE